MLKRKPLHKTTEKESRSTSAHPGKLGLDDERQGRDAPEGKRRTGEAPAGLPSRTKLGPDSRQFLHKSVPPGHGNNPDLLKYYLAQNFASPANLAREANVSRAAVSAVIHGRTRSERIERMIAKSCDKTLQALFPAWYPEANEP